MKNKSYKKIKNVLITGGTGYIGSHTAISLIKQGYNVIIIDDLSNSSRQTIKKLSSITGKKIKFIKNNLSNEFFLKKTINENNINSIIHFAALKSVEESIEKPFLYMHNNIISTSNLLSAMKGTDCQYFIFSSSACVYGVPKKLPIKENHQLQACNPYGQTKIICEDLINKFLEENNEINAATLRYFNPIGAHESGIIGENPSKPSNLMPVIINMLKQNIYTVKIFGKNYDTVDGTPLRDFIHVMDIADGHVSALNYLRRNNKNITVNLGTGKGYTVLQLVKTFIKETGIDLTIKFTSRRKGDVAKNYANITKAKKLLKWEPKRSLSEMCISAYRSSK